MSYCLNPECQKPYNPSGTRFCQSCGAKLLLGDRYRAIKPIGQGGFGKTFLAIDEYKPSQPQCVIKQFFPQLQGANAEKAAELFRREAMQLDELGKHSQIPELFAHFEQDRRQYLVQEFIDGQNLEQELTANGTFNELQIRQLLRDLLPVLQFLHQRQIVHRDIKPENIIRRSAVNTEVKTTTNFPSPPEEKTGELVLVDFGASKVVTETNFGQTGTTIGSAGYVAPEQLMGKALPASDLYNLGVTCIYLLTQVSPFELFDVTEGNWIWRQYLPSPITEGLGQIFDKLLANDLARRYQSASEVWAAVIDLREEPVVVSGNANSGKNSSFFTRMLGGFPQVIKGRIMQEFGQVEAAIAAYDRAISLRPNNANAWYKKAGLCYRLQRYQEALGCYEKTVKLKPEIWEAWRDRGLLLYKFNREKEAIDSYFQSLEIQPHQPMVWLWLSLAIKRSGDDKKAEMCLSKAKELLPLSPVETAEILWRAWENLIW